MFVASLLLQFLLLPIRDWNKAGGSNEYENVDCNFYYSLLGIETSGDNLLINSLIIAISITPY